MADLRAAVVGLAFFLGCVYGFCLSYKSLDWAECHGEHTPYLGSGRQAHVTPWCLLRDENWLIGLKKRLGIYEPRWQTVIE